VQPPDQQYGLTSGLREVRREVTRPIRPSVIRVAMSSLDDPHTLQRQDGSTTGEVRGASCPTGRFDAMIDGPYRRSRMRET